MYSQASEQLLSCKEATSIGTIYFYIILLRVYQLLVCLSRIVSEERRS